MAELKFSCKTCGQAIACDEEYAGVAVNCPACKVPLTVPAAETAEPLVAEIPSEKMDVFISYRREGGEDLAMLVRQALQQRGFGVFVDVENLKSGKFNTAILRNIAASTDVVLICSKGALDRCVNDDDWVRQEIRHALRCGKNVVRLMDRNFVMPPKESLPPDIVALADSVELSPAAELWEASMDRLVEHGLKSRPAAPAKKAVKASQQNRALTNIRMRAMVAHCIGWLGLLLVLFCLPFCFFAPKPLNLVIMLIVVIAGACNGLIVFGARLSDRVNPLGPKFVLFASIVMLVANLICSFKFMNAADQTGKFNPSPVAAFKVNKRTPPALTSAKNHVMDYLFWSVNIAPFALLVFLHRKGR